MLLGHCSGWWLQTRPHSTDVELPAEVSTMLRRRYPSTSGVEQVISVERILLLGSLDQLSLVYAWMCVQNWCVHKTHCRYKYLTGRIWQVHLLLWVSASMYVVFTGYLVLIFMLWIAVWVWPWEECAYVFSLKYRYRGTGHMSYYTYYICIYICIYNFYMYIYSSPRLPNCLYIEPSH